VIEITLITVFLIGTFMLVRFRPARFLAGYLLASLGLFMLGILFWIAGEVPLLRAYWFRLADTMVPLGSLLLAGCWIDRLVRGHLTQGTASSPGSGEAPRVRLVERSLHVAAVALSIGLAPRLATKIQSLLDRNSWIEPATASMDRWIRENTPTDAIFLISPVRDDFYIRTGRSIVVNFKASPQQDPVAMHEWFDRLQLVNQDRPFATRGFERMAEIRRAFDTLGEGTVRLMRRRYGARYLLTGSSRPYSFPVLHSANGLVLYEIVE
jgi:hypothetical protein